MPLKGIANLGVAVQIHKTPWVISPAESRHKLSGGVSHHLPRLHKTSKFLFPISLDDVTKSEDSEFRIQYALECLLRHGHLRAADVSELLQKLRDLRKWEVAGKYSEELDALVKELPAVHRCNDGTLALSKVLPLSPFEHCLMLSHSKTQ